jgi:hypothetical protein
MVSVVLGMLVCVFLALVVMALVAVPARREGREVLSERGEDIVGSIRERQLTLARGERRERDERDERDDEDGDRPDVGFDALVGARG